MKKLLASAVLFTLLSSYVKPEEESVYEPRFFRDTEFTFACNDSNCSTVTATANNVTFSGDAESMKFLQTNEGKEMMDKMLQRMVIECIKGNVKSIDEPEIAK